LGRRRAINKRQQKLNLYLSPIFKRGKEEEEPLIRGNRNEVNNHFCHALPLRRRRAINKRQQKLTRRVSFTNIQIPKEEEEPLIRGNRNNILFSLFRSAFGKKKSH